MTVEPENQAADEFDTGAPAETTPDQAATGLHMWFRRILGVVLLAALLVVIIRGIYVVCTIQQSPVP